MDFFDRQTHARKESRRLAWLFGLALLAVLAMNNLVGCTLIALFRDPPLANTPAWHLSNLLANAFNLLALARLHPGKFATEVFHPHWVLWVSLGSLHSIAGGSWYKLHELAAGGSVVARFLGGRRVAAQVDDPDENRLRHVVEEMAIASGLPVPEIFVLDCERGINAFAAGHTHDDVAIGVTRGAVMLLGRDELQGVIAHEFSHITSRCAATCCWPAARRWPRMVG